MGTGAAGSSQGASSSNQPASHLLNKPSASESIINFNAVLLYNCAAMSFQTQQFGQCIAYINLVLRQIENVEGFILVKTLFLLL